MSDSIVSDLVYSGDDGSSAGGTYVTSSSAASFFATEEAKAKALADYKANNYNHSGVNTYSPSAFTDDNINLANPYTKTVIIGMEKGTTVSYTAGVPSFTDWYKTVYGTNQAYIDFEKNIYAAQVDAYSKIEANLNTNNEQSLSVEQDNLIDGFMNRVSPSIVDSIIDISGNIISIKNELYQLELQDILTPDYNRILNTNNTKTIESVKAQLESFTDQYNSLVDDYDARYKAARALQDAANASNWNFDSFWISDPYEGYSGRTGGAIQDTKSYITLNTSNEMNRWMAGGDLYDAPRAGDVLFNVAGNLNTVRFLGIQDTNPYPDLGVAFANPEVFKMLRSFAGDENFNIFQ